MNHICEHCQANSSIELCLKTNCSVKDIYPVKVLREMLAEKPKRKDK